VYSKLQRLGYVVLAHKSCPAAPEKSSTAPAALAASKPPDDDVEVIDLAEEERFRAFDQFVPSIRDKSQLVVRVAPNHLLPPNAIPVRKEYLLKFGGTPAPQNFNPQQKQNRPRQPFNNFRLPFNLNFRGHNNFNGWELI